MQVSNSFWNVFQQYFGNGIILPIFFMALVWLLKKSDKEKKTVFFAVLCMSILLLYNGVSYYMIKRVGEGSTYYRFFWICPVALVISYSVVEFLSLYRAKKVSLLFILGLAVYMFSGSQISSWFLIPDNIYQMDDDVIQVADAVMAATKGKETTLIDDGTIKDIIRQYNAKINFTELYTHQINQVLYTGKTGYLGRYVQDYISLNESEYVAIQKDKKGTAKVLESAGLKRIAETDGYLLYHVNHDKIEADWQLLDNMDENGVSSNIEYIPLQGADKEYRYVYLTDFGAGEDVYQKVMKEIAALEIEGVFINAAASEACGWETEYEELLKKLEVPYYCNNKEWQLVETSAAVFCMIDNRFGVSEAVKEEFWALQSYGKPIIMILSSKIEDNEEFYDIITAEESCVAQILTVENGNYEKILINDSFLQYAAAMNSGQRLNILSVCGLKE